MNKNVSNKKSKYICLRQDEGVDCVDGSDSAFLLLGA